MLKFEKNSEITLLGDKYLMDKVLKNLAKLHSEEIIQYFHDLNIRFPRIIRVLTLKNIFRENVLETRQNRHTLADEMNYRLSWFNQFTEVQLVNLFKFYKDDELQKLYLHDLWINILNELVNQEIKQHDLKNLLDLKSSKKDVEDILVFNNNLNVLFFDEKGEIDGLTQDQIRPVLFKSSTITEIRELGKKYGVNVPVRLKKKELIELIVEELKERGEYSEKKEEELNKMNLVLIQRFTRVNDIKVSTELKKEEVIEYILSHATETKSSYYVPSASLYKELESPIIINTPVEEEIEELIVQKEPVVEEVIEEVIEVIIEPEEEVIEPIVEKPVEIIKEVVTEKVVYVNDNHVVPKETYDYTKVEKTVINTTEFHGKKASEFELSIFNEEVVNEDSNNNEDDNLEGYYKTRMMEEGHSGKKTNVFLEILIWILSLAFILFLLLFIYALFTPNQAPAVIEKFEKAISTKFFEFFRKMARAILPNK